ncbi:aurora kinase A-interacting protein [Conger conger]|uniref:aurora kinase A-interacting protein n=1 Tax=Conger conger TaxID=82655 RepID=UPI002A598990|nr:aurora kinase A-interacting protein [Conger conger]
MFLSRVALSLNAISRVPGAVTAGVAVRRLCSPPPACCYSTAPTGSPLPPRRWTALDPELEEALVPRKMSVSPLESWLSLRYSLPPVPGDEVAPPVDGRTEDRSALLPPAVEPVLGDRDRGEGAPASPLSCKNVMEIRRRKMNRHKYRKLMQRTVFLRKRVLHGRSKKKQSKFEKDLQRIWFRAGLRKPAEGWNAPKIFIRQNKSKRH